jgi:hypothetical protein
MAISTGQSTNGIETRKVEFTPLINTTPNRVITTGLTITPKWDVSGVESVETEITTEAVLKIKISDYDSHAGKNQTINILCLNAQ